MATFRFRSDIKPFRCLIQGCTRTAEIVPKSQRSQAWRLPQRSADDEDVSQTEWEMWLAGGLASYCLLHKCDVQGCDDGVLVDDHGRVYNLCRSHCKKSEEKERAKLAGKGPFSVRELLGLPARPNRGLPSRKCRETIANPVGPAALCVETGCKRLQIVDGKGKEGHCEVHTAFPLLPVAEDGSVQNLPIVTIVTAAGVAVEAVNLTAGLLTSLAGL